MESRASLMFITLMVMALLLVSPTHGRSVLEELNDFDSTVVDLGLDEPSSPAHKLVKRSALLEEIMGPLSRNTRQVSETERSTLVYTRMKVLLLLLRYHLGGSPNIEILEFQNWDRTIQIDQLFYTRPTTIWEVRRVIMAARSLGMRVRATGAGHSRSPLYVDEGNIMMDVRELERHDGPMIELHEETAQRPYKTITAMTGVHTFELNEFMTENFVTIYSEPLNDQETLGGILAAGSHGSTYEATSMPGFVVEMRLMDSMGRLRKFSVEEHPEFMRALSLNLGMFGVMYDITIKVEPALIVKVENFFPTVGEILLDKVRLKEQVENNLLNEINWFPFNNISPEEEQAYISTLQVPDTWAAAEDFLWIRTINVATEEEYQGQPIQGKIVLPTNGSLSGDSTVGLLRAKGSLDLARELPDLSFHYLQNAYPIIDPPPFGSETNAAFMLNIDEDFDRPYRAIRYNIETTEQQIKAEGSTPMNVILARFFKNADCFLCLGNNAVNQDNDNGHTVVIDILAPPTQEGYYEAAANFAQAFKDEKLRPHWAKRHDNIEGIIDTIHSTYGQLIPAFIEQRQLAWVDPCDMFMNAYLIAIFGRSQSCYFY